MSSISLSVRDRYDFADKDLYNILRLLYKDLAPSKEEQQIAIATRYNKAREASQGDINTWVNKFKAAAGQYRTSRADK
jgi:predicted AlkP superfamily pyrophosphatase or phosphodiesterase